MPDKRKKNKNIRLKTPAIGEYSILEDKNFGFKNVVRWSYDNPDIIGFKVYRAKVSFPLMKGNYSVSQKALEKLAAIKEHPSLNQKLFNENIFEPNSKMEVFDKEQEAKPEKIRSYNFKRILFLRKTRNNKYEFVDKNIKFGKTYAYAISAVDKHMKESPRSQSILINVEDLENPLSPSEIKAITTPSGILFTIKSDDPDVSEFDLYKRRYNSGSFEYVDTIENFEGRSENYIDEDIIPGVLYNYRVYSVNYFNKTSLDSAKVTIGDDLFFKRGTIPLPEFSITLNSGSVEFKGLKNSRDIVGYRLERQDAWRNEKGFEVKSNEGISWPYLIPFDENNESTFTDLSVIRDKIYKYKISSIRNNGLVASTYITPFVKIDTDKEFHRLFDPLSDLDLPVIENFDVGLVNKKQNPPYISFEWTISGAWSHIIILAKNKKTGNIDRLRVEDLHENFFYKAIKNTQYKIEVSLYNLNGKLAETKKGIVVNT